MTDHAVVVVTDATFFDEAHRVVREVQQHCPSSPDIYCFHRGLVPAQIARLARVPRVHPVALDDVGVREGPLEHHEDVARSPLFYARFECWSERFDAYATVTYLDVDIVVRGDLVRAAHADFAIAPEIRGGSPFDDPDDPRLRARLAADGWSGEFDDVANAGVFVVGRRWRTPAQRALIDRIIDRYGEFLRVGDQSVLNLWLHANGLRPTMDPAFNCQMVRTLADRGAVRVVGRARILHFNGLRLSNQLLALRITRECLRVPLVGPGLVVVALRLTFEGYARRPAAGALVRRAARLRGRARTLGRR